MDISRNNYEIWAIDYLEGKLSTEQSACFMLFLAENPDLSAELDGMRDFTAIESVKEEAIDFSNLKKEFSDSTIKAQNFEEYCIAYYEGDLNNTSAKQLLAYAHASEENLATFKAYERVFIKADKAVVYKNKRGLKKGAAIKRLNKHNVIRLSLSAAASLLLLFTFIGILRNYSSPQAILGDAKPNIELATPKTAPTTEIAARKSNETRTIALVKRPSAVATRPQAFDTTDRPDVFIPAVSARIEVIQLQAPSTKNSIIAYSNLQDYHQKTNTTTENILEAIQVSSYNTYTSIRHLNLDKVMRKSVDGINQMAETDLQYNSDTDEEGRLIAFALSTDKFNMRKKIRN